MKSEKAKVIDGLVSMAPIDGDWVDIGTLAGELEFSTDAPPSPVDVEKMIESFKVSAETAQIKAKVAQKHIDEIVKMLSNIPKNAPKINIKWWDNDAIFAKVLRVELRFPNDQMVTQEFTISHEMLAQASKHEYKYIKENIAKKMVIELDHYHPMPDEVAQYIFNQIVSSFDGKTTVQELDIAMSSGNAGAEFLSLARKLPAVDQMVDHPQLGDPLSYVGKLLKCQDKKRMSLQAMVIHLNDHHKWTREKIADWIDELHDSGIIDAEFHIDTEEI